MAEKEIRVLSDKSIVPTDEYIFLLIGEHKIHWKRIMNFLSENYKDSSGSWNYYNDGKQWLYKMVNKKKTVFWARILNDTFRITFYLGNKADTLIDSSDLPQAVKNEFKTAKRYGLIRPVSFIVENNADVDNVIKMVEIKSKLK